MEKENYFEQQSVRKRILVTGTMSAGKSTLVNALIGRKIMVTRNESCTANTFVIKENLTIGNKVYCHHKNTKLELKKEIAEVLHNINSEEILIHTRMNHFNDKYLWEIIDTPGVNSSADPEHKQIAERIIASNKFDVLLYVMNGNHLGTHDDLQHLEYIKNNVIPRKIIFVINKIDQFRRREDSVERSVRNVKKQLNELGFQKKIIQPVSAYTGYLIKKSENEKHELNEDEIDELFLLNKKFERAEFNLSSYHSKKQKKYNSEFLQQLSNCGVFALEQLISRKGVKHG